MSDDPMNSPNPPIPRERLKRNLEIVLENIRAAAEKASRSASGIKLVAVTKYSGLDELFGLLELGVRDFGESRIQDAERKIKAVSTRTTTLLDPPHWHLIGHLQTNKVDKAARLFQGIHSIDSLRVAQGLNKEALKARLCPGLSCLLEVNVAGEEKKFGLRPDMAEIGALLKSCAELGALRITGLMAMAPHSDNPESTSRPVFRRLREILQELNNSPFYPRPLTELSMGMTQDYGIAVEEGATMVRVGSALFL